MNHILIWIGLLVGLTLNLTKAQNPESFFPHNIGDRWDYIELHMDNSSSHFTNGPITRDSVGPDGSHNLFYDSYFYYPQYRIDTSLNIFEAPQSPNWNYLLYKLDADTGDVWEGIDDGINWAWLAREESSYVFSIPTIIKEYRYGPGRPDSANSRGFLENWLASGFGLVYSESESRILYLNGCVIAGDTFGIITSVEDMNVEIPAAFLLKQNYPNPFNPSTTIEFELPHEAEINISVYDILGHKIDILYDGLKPTGFYKIQWKALGLASGIYLCRIRANESVRTIKMLLSK